MEIDTMTRHFTTHVYKDGAIFEATDLVHAQRIVSAHLAKQVHSYAWSTHLSDERRPGSIYTTINIYTRRGFGGGLLRSFLITEIPNAAP
jgi:(2Fe-2S) ferredoxin